MRASFLASKSFSMSLRAFMIRYCRSSSGVFANVVNVFASCNGDRKSFHSVSFAKEGVVAKVIDVFAICIGD